MKKYYGLYDLQLDDFKPGIAGTNYSSVEEIGAERAFVLSQAVDEPTSDNMTNKEILDEYGYEVREVSEEEYKEILISQKSALLTSVTL
ncbi:hypothetical protein WKH56_09310 [Priestia sp. SB1]|uniref:Uncharacterized protein n=1 Tax=Priestia aryabhattai TaxID=412384 RepID=A0AAX6NEB9_PRIAR|nr:hypothetical protein [Priestia aryabhattai]MDU9693855.1 hypothetical protein [Priestia aryabhattai]NGY88855.1 hypothetical protein [Priestia megaterium]